MRFVFVYSIRLSFRNIHLQLKGTDESLQRFVTTNRSGSVLDVVLDLTGVGIGLLLLYRAKKYK
ncbi:hypothetical protein LLG10_08040 [bacterium]|nr:hypothetical protein [bacterium]